MTEAAGASVGGVYSASGVGSFDVFGTATGAGSLDVDDYTNVAAVTFFLDPFYFRCSHCLTVFIFVEVEAVKNICEPNRLSKRLPNASTSYTVLCW